MHKPKKEDFKVYELASADPDYKKYNGIVYNNYMYQEALRKHKTLAKGGDLSDVSGSVIKPPIGLMPKRFYEVRINAKRFNEVCGAISRYYNAGMKINTEWIEEYNDLVESVGK